MTPEEKAKELIHKMYGVRSHSMNEITKHFAKMSALIAVDEIINTLNMNIRDVDVRGNVLLDLIEYWQEVKRNIKEGGR